MSQLKRGSEVESAGYGGEQTRGQEKGITDHSEGIYIYIQEGGDSSGGVKEKEEEQVSQVAQTHK